MSSSSYVGLYVTRLAGGIISVTVRSTTGNHRGDFSRQEYEAKDIAPAFDSLPSKEEYERAHQGQ